mgnify:CR=1 FL=1
MGSELDLEKIRQSNIDYYRCLLRTGTLAQKSEAQRWLIKWGVL